VLDPKATESPSERDRRERGIGYRMFAIGYMTASEAIAGLLLGAGVDWVFGFGPWGLVVGGIAGVGVGMWSLVRRSLQLQSTLGGRSPGERPVRDRPKSGTNVQ
jgi:F0F1-type ATP synthase assembly protein I